MIPFLARSWFESQGADLTKHSQSLGQPQSFPIAVIRERNAVDQLHDEERPAGFRRPGIQDLGDVGVSHERKSLAFRLKPRQHGPGIHPGPDELECDLALYRLDLFGEVNDPHASLADLLE